MQVIKKAPTILKTYIWAHFAACEFLRQAFTDTEGRVKPKISPHTVKKRNTCPAAEHTAKYVVITYLRSDTFKRCDFFEKVKVPSGSRHQLYSTSSWPPLHNTQTCKHCCILVVFI